MLVLTIILYIIFGISSLFILYNLYIKIKLYFRFKKFVQEYNKLDSEVSRYEEIWFKLTPIEREFEKQCLQEEFKILLVKYKDLTE